MFINYLMYKSVGCGSRRGNNPDESEQASEDVQEDTDSGTAILLGVIGDQGQPYAFGTANLAYDSPLHIGSSGDVGRSEYEYEFSDNITQNANSSPQVSDFPPGDGLQGSYEDIPDEVFEIEMSDEQEEKLVTL